MASPSFTRKTMMLKKTLAIVLSGLLAWSMASCSGSSEEAETTPTPTVSETPTPTPSVDLPDPRTLTGVSAVTGISDPTPIEGNYTQSLPVTLTDEDGVEVTVTDTSRVIPLDIYGTISRTIIALGYGDTIVGRTVSSTEEQLADLPVVTENGHTLNVEAILNLQPTLIVSDRSVGPPEAFDQIRAAGIPLVMITSQRSLELNSTITEQIAKAYGVPDAGAELNERIDKEVKEAQEQIAQWVPETPLDIAFLYVRGTAGIFFILGSDEGATELIEAVGGHDVASANNLGALTPANAESLVTIDPEVIFVMEHGLDSTGGLEGFMARPGVAETRAGKNQRLVTIPDGVSLAFGPQTAEVILKIAEQLYGVEES